MKYFKVFVISLLVLPFFTHASTGACQAGDLFDIFTGQKCGQTAGTASVCAPGDLFNTQTGQSCTATSAATAWPSNTVYASGVNLVATSSAPVYLANPNDAKIATLQRQIKDIQDQYNANVYAIQHDRNSSYDTGVGLSDRYTASIATQIVNLQAQITLLQSIPAPVAFSISSTDSKDTILQKLQEQINLLSSKADVDSIEKVRRLQLDRHDVFFNDTPTFPLDSISSWLYSSGL